MVHAGLPILVIVLSDVIFRYNKVFDNVEILYFGLVIVYLEMCNVEFDRYGKFWWDVVRDLV